MALKNKFKQLSQNCGVPFYSALPKHSGDNAGMIAFAGFIEFEYLEKNTANGLVKVEPSLCLVNE